MVYLQEVTMYLYGVIGIIKKCFNESVFIHIIYCGGGVDLFWIFGGYNFLLTGG